MQRIDIESLDDSAIANINALIEAYEKKLAESVRSQKDEPNVLISSYTNLVNLEVPVLANLDASHLQSILNAPDVSDSSEKESDISEVNNEYFSCDIIDQDGKVTNSFFEGEDIKSYENTIGVPVAKRLTNEVNVKIKANLSSWVDDLITNDETGKKDFNFGIDQCFECKLDYDRSIVLPELNYVLDFRNLLDKAKNLINFLKQNLDPTMMVSNICEFLRIFGDNLLCPSNLVGIQALLPTLFIQYSKDLLSFNLDFTIVLGGIVKSIMGALSSVTNGIKNALLPYLDCLINVFVYLKRYYITIIESGEKISNEALSLANKTMELAGKTADLFSEDPEVKQKEAKAKLRELEKLSEQASKLVQEKRSLDNQNQSLTESYEREIDEFVNEVGVLKNDGTQKTREELFSEFKLFLNGKGSSSILFEKEEVKERLATNLMQQKALKRQGSRYQLLKEQESSLKEYSNKKIKPAPKESKDSNLSITSEDKGINSKNSFTLGLLEKSKGNQEIINLRKNVYRNRSDTTVIEDLMNKYNLNLTDTYYRSEDKISSDVDIRDMGISWSIIGFFDRTIKNLKEVRKNSLNFINKLNGTFSAIGGYTSESLDASFRLNGEMLNLIHYVRAIQVVINLIKLMGDVSCDDIIKNPKLLANLNETDLVKDLEIKLGMRKDSLVVSEIDPDSIAQVREISQTDCGSLNNLFDINETNLDEIYEGIADGFFRKV